MTSTPITTHLAPNRARTAGVRSRSAERITMPVAYVYLMWIVALTDVHRWIAERGLNITAMHRAQAILLVPLVIMLITKMPQMLGKSSRPVWYLPFLGFLASMIVSSLGVPEWDKSFEMIKLVAGYYVLALGTLVYLNTPRRVTVLLIMFVGQFWWWGWHSGTTGAVWWHPSYANFDSFGPLVLFGLPVTLFFGLSARSPWYRFGGFFLGAFCALAIVASFARGVILSAVLVVIVSLLRAPRRYRMKTAAALLIGIFSFMITSATLFPNGFILTEVQSAFTEGKDEGTGRDRWELWTAALAGWRTKPLFGVGAEQIRRVSYELVRDGKVVLDPESVYSRSPITLYYRELHNVWVQILAEGGLVGLGAVIWLIADFWRRNAALRRPEACEYWARVTNGRFKLNLLAVGLESGMVAFVATGMFYNQLYEAWFFSMLIVNLMLHIHSRPPTPRAVRGSRRAAALPR